MSDTINGILLQSIVLEMLASSALSPYALQKALQRTERLSGIANPFPFLNKALEEAMKVDDSDLGG